MSNDNLKEIRYTFDRQIAANDFENAEKTINTFIDCSEEAQDMDEYVIGIQGKGLVCEKTDRILEACCYYKQAVTICIVNRLERLPEAALTAVPAFEKAGRFDDELNILIETIDVYQVYSESMPEVYRKIVKLRGSDAGIQNLIIKAICKNELSHQVLIVQAVAKDYYNNNDFQNALKYFEAIDFKKTSGLMKFSVYQMMGCIYDRLGNHKKAIILFMQAGFVALCEGDLYSISVLNLNLGIAYMQDNQLAAASARITDSYAIAERNGFKDVLGQIEKMEKAGLLGETQQSEV